MACAHQQQPPRAGGSASTQAFVWNAIAPVPVLLMDSANAYINETGSTPAEQISFSNGAVSYLVRDTLGSVRGIVNPSGALAASTIYDAWGNPQTAGGLSSYTPYGYAGGYTDPTGLIYLTNRYYDPATGQFLSADPEARSTQEPYGYAYGKPISNSDPSGLAPNAGWSGTSQGGAETEATVASYGWNNDVGCHGYYVHYPDIMSCTAVATDYEGQKVPLREGYYNLKEMRASAEIKRTTNMVSGPANS